MRSSIGAFTIGVFLAGWLLVSCSSSQSPAPRSDSTPAATQCSARQATAQSEADAPPYFESADAARPFPQLLPASHFRAHSLAARAYKAAAEIPEVAAQQPCYCHCFGHRSLLDCYVADHAAG